MGPGTKTEEEEGTPTIAGQGEPGTGPGQLQQEPQHQSEHGLQPIADLKEDREPEGAPVNQAEQNKKPGDHDDGGAE